MVILPARRYFLGAVSSPDPIATVLAWLEEAKAAGLRIPEAMVLATASAEGRPSARVVLFRGMSGEGLTFFTNYESRKARELEVRDHAAAVFYWEPLGRQVRIEGRVEKLAPQESDAYFAQRPRGSQLSAVVSPQSRPIERLEELRRRRDALQAELGDRPVPRPENWGGYRLVPELVELWEDGADRMHERRLYRRVDGGWTMSHLAP